MRQLDLLANEFRRESPELMQMSVRSQLSAITEVDEDLIRGSSLSLSAHSSIEKSGHLRNLLETESSGNDEEPNLFAAVGTPTISDEIAPETAVRHPEEQDEKIEDPPLQAEEHPEDVKKTKNDDVREKFKRNRMLGWKGEEITLDSYEDEEDSSGGISDITEEFLQIPVSSPLFKKAMAMFKEIAGEEEMETIEIEESRDDLDALKPLATLEI